MSIVCEHFSYMEQNFTHSSNHEQKLCFVIVQKKSKKVHNTGGRQNLNNVESFEVEQNIHHAGLLAGVPNSKSFRRRHIIALAEGE